MPPPRNHSSTHRLGACRIGICMGGSMICEQGWELRLGLGITYHRINSVTVVIRAGASNMVQYGYDLGHNHDLGHPTPKFNPNPIWVQVTIPDVKGWVSN